MKKIWTCVLGAVIFALLGLGYAEWRKGIMVQELSQEVFRFHVIANSDSAQDQELKMQVKEELISYMETTLPENADLQETVQWALCHTEELEKRAAKVVQGEGFSYDVSAVVGKEMFPQKTYGDITFPAGEYDALRIEIGEGEGRNWWCVLYPSLCFIDAVHAVVPEEGKKRLEKVLEEETYDMITHPPRWKISWFFF